MYLTADAINIKHQSPVFGSYQSVAGFMPCTMPRG